VASPPHPSAIVLPSSPADPKSVSLAKAVPTKPNAHSLLCVWHGASLGIWLRLLASRPPMSWSHWWRIASVSAVSPLNSLSNLLESLFCGGRIARQQIEHPPIFILGHWRSGTTLLHNLMTLDPELTYPNLFQVMAPNNFLLTESWVTKLTRWTLPKTRPMDNMAADWELPQEDEMALLLMTLMSPYLMLAHQKDPSQFRRYFDLTELTPREYQTWHAAFLRFLKKLTIRKNKPIVLKSPSHTFRIPVLLKMFPEAKFVYIYRDPYAVFNSGVHLRRTLFLENGLGTPYYDSLEDDVLQVYSQCFETYESTKHLIPPSHLHEVRFEDLESDPLGQMKRVYEKIGLTSWPLVEPLIRQQVPELTQYKKNKYQMDEALMRRVYEAWKPSFDLYGYPSQLPGDDGVP
jgi:omega-hydroxy-beta-dihydromenaquinone-9 sulfotransferase